MEDARNRRRRRGWLFGGLAAIAVLIAACTGTMLLLKASLEPRFLTTNEAQLLASSRFNNFNVGTREITIELPQPGETVRGTGVFDYAEGVGVAKVSADDGPASLVWWSYDMLGEQPLEDDDIDLAEAVESLDADDDWNLVSRDAAVGTPIGAALVFVAGYGSDRPDNPKLIEQSDAVWLKDVDESTWVQLPSADQVRDSAAVPTQSPNRPSVLLSQKGSIREARLGGEGTGVTTIRFGASSSIAVPVPERSETDGAE